MRRGFEIGATGRSRVHWLFDKPGGDSVTLITRDLAVRVEFEPLRGQQNQQLADSSLPGVSELPVLPSRIARDCPRPEQASLRMPHAIK
jgi:hypothetical protein